jgi:hypothetical protein
MESVKHEGEIWLLAEVDYVLKLVFSAASPEATA